jgi:hypothetical protein
VHTDITTLLFLGLAATSAADGRSYLLFRLLAKRPERLIGCGMDPPRSPTNLPELRRVFPSDAGGAYLEKLLPWTFCHSGNVVECAAAAEQMCRLRPRCFSRAVLGRARRDYLDASSGLSAIRASARRGPLGDDVRDSQCHRRRRRGAISGNRAPGQLRLRNIERDERVSTTAILACVGASVPARHTPC